MSDDDKNRREDPASDESKPRESIGYKILKGIGVLMAVLAVIAILIVGLALGACFLGSRR
jgi:hypothetical protein